MSDIYSDSVYLQIKTPSKKPFPSPLKTAFAPCLKLSHTSLMTSNSHLAKKTARNSHTFCTSKPRAFKRATYRSQGRHLKDML